MTSILSKRVITLSLLLCGVVTTQAADDEKNWGTLHGSYETSTIYYVDDAKTGVSQPDMPIGSNNYLKLDYTLGNFSAGIQAEYYPQVLEGFQSEFEGIGIPEKYIAWNDQSWSVTVGDFYDQFGNGLVFRAWEDRQLGLNNSLGGVRATFNLFDYLLTAKVIYGFPRDYMHSTGQGYGMTESLFSSYTNSQVAGGDLSLSLSQLLFPESMHVLYLEGSLVNRYEEGEIPAVYTALNPSQNMLSYSARVAYEYGALSIKGEYVGKSEDVYESHKTEDWELGRGDAQLLEINYSANGFSLSTTLRRLNNMQTLAYRTTDGGAALAGNTLNYVPTLSQQHAYMLASLNPYAGYAAGEMGGQIDLFYSLKRGTMLGGKYGTKLHLNASSYYTPASALSTNHDTAQLSYRELTFDVEKSWNRQLKSIFFLSIQELSPSHGEYVATQAQNVFVLDTQYKFSRKVSLRTELQYLYSQELDKDWMAALLELSFAPKWSVFASDMYNHGSTTIHYYSTGASYTYSMWRIAASYGRNRAGMVCSGGVCRYQPAYTGGNLQLSLLF